MSAQAQGFYTAPSDKDTPQQDRGLFNHESQKHQCHHYARMYGGQAVNAMMWGFGATLGADAANAAVGEMRACRQMEMIEWTMSRFAVDFNYLINTSVTVSNKLHTFDGL
ncbi:hypothetical protein M436DRAFT_63126 [Aureobasidium namibiae CBS 147.97]|uniref:Uncharacterized protein n=1 Tax=Aureobasidium namibiae CBS 147.97 TaxID=1043004 RepID=A0A074WKZ7_9PEZI